MLVIVLTNIEPNSDINTYFIYLCYELWGLK